MSILRLRYRSTGTCKSFTLAFFNVDFLGSGDDIAQKIVAFLALAHIFNCYWEISFRKCGAVYAG